MTTQATNIFGELITTGIEAVNLGEYKYLVTKYVNGYSRTVTPAKSYGAAKIAQYRILKSV